MKYNDCACDICVSTVGPCWRGLFLELRGWLGYMRSWRW